MTAKELKQLRYIKKLIERNEARLADFEVDNLDDIRLKLQIEEEQRALIAEKERIESFITAIPDRRIKMIFRLRFCDDLSWRTVAARLGGGNTEDSVRKICSRYLIEFVDTESRTGVRVREKKCSSVLPRKDKK